MTHSFPTRRSSDLKAAPAGVAPQWRVDRLSHLPVPDRTLAAGRAALDLRVNRLKADQDAVLAAFPGSAPTDHAPDGVRLAEAVAIDAHPLFRNGSVEGEGLGSRILAPV